MPCIEIADEDFLSRLDRTRRDKPHAVVAALCIPRGAIEKGKKKKRKTEKKKKRGIKCKTAIEKQKVNLHAHTWRRHTQTHNYRMCSLPIEQTKTWRRHTRIIRGYAHTHVDSTHASSGATYTRTWTVHTHARVVRTHVDMDRDHGGAKYRSLSLYLSLTDSISAPRTWGRRSAWMCSLPIECVLFL